MNELDRAWAETQVEALADGSLSAAAEQRMRSLMGRDPVLRQRVETARQLRSDLARLARRPAPAGLWWRLWKIPAGERPQRTNLLAAFALAAVAAVAVGIGLLQQPHSSEEELAAVQDLATAMAYLQKGVLMVTREVNQNLGAELTNAYAVSREMIGTEETDD